MINKWDSRESVSFILGHPGEISLRNANLSRLFPSPDVATTNPNLDTCRVYMYTACTQGTLHPTFKESLYSAHLLYHGSKLGVLANEFLHLSLTGTRPSRHSSKTTRLTKHLGSLRVVQLCRCGTCGTVLLCTMYSLVRWSNLTL